MQVHHRDVGLGLRDELVARLGGAGDAGHRPAEAGYQLVAESEPDVAVVDLHLASEGGGDALIRRLSEGGNRTRIVVFTATSDPRELRDVLKAGADAIVLKEGGLPELLAGLEAVTRGERFLSPSLDPQV